VKTHDQLDPRCASFYRDAMKLLQRAKVRFMVGGAFALAKYTGIERFTKDFDVFVMPCDSVRALDAFADAGFRTEMTASHWLAKAFKEDLFVDLIWSSGNGVAKVDDAWFVHATMDTVLRLRVPLVPAEEMIWQKAYIMERERFDGADVLHLLHARADDLDWDRLLRRFGEHWRVLLAHLVLFGFAYPTERGRVPQHVMHMLAGRLETELGPDEKLGRITRATLLSRHQYRDDIARGRYRDARLGPPADLTEEDLRECA
jgi:hypothetical protein